MLDRDGVRDMLDLLRFDDSERCVGMLAQHWASQASFLLQVLISDHGFISSAQHLGIKNFIYFFFLFFSMSGMLFSVNLSAWDEKNTE